MVKLIERLNEGFDRRTNVILQNVLVILTIALCTIFISQISSRADIQMFSQLNSDDYVNSQYLHQTSDDLAKEAKSYMYDFVYSKSEYTQTITSDGKIVICSTGKAHNLAELAGDYITESSTFGYAVYTDEFKYSWSVMVIEQ